MRKKGGPRCISFWMLLGLACCSILIACSTYTPYEYQDERELLPGPGLFSGEDGQFTLMQIPNHSETGNRESSKPQE
jgi:hypothetical protein